MVFYLDEAKNGITPPYTCFTKFCFCLMKRDFLRKFECTPKVS